MKKFYNANYLQKVAYFFECVQRGNIVKNM